MSLFTKSIHMLNISFLMITLGLIQVTLKAEGINSRMARKEKEKVVVIRRKKLAYKRNSR